jgi:glyoxylase-like metal-dependent hydrolase (beta-lactamase superfamily II)
VIRQLGSTMRVLQPAPNVLAFYDGRVDGVRAWSGEPNWLDDGAFSLGVCSYAVFDGGEAIVYDTHISPAHARLIRATLEERGIRSIRVVLSHWHADHIAGNVVFQDCEIIANRLTAALLAEQKAKIESGEPPIRPLVGPNRLFEGRMTLQLGTLAVELHQFDIHSRDGTVLLLPRARLLLAGDTLEDPITYVDEPDRLDRHLLELERLSGLPVDRILPAHGHPEVIAGGGFGRGLIGANRSYVEKLLRSREDPALAGQDLRRFVADDLGAGTIRFFGPYEAVHHNNIQKVLAQPPA